MGITITTPRDLETRLRHEAAAQQRSVEEVAIGILRAPPPTETLPIEAVVARIRATAPNPASIRPASGSLGDALADEAGVENLDVGEWQAAWQVAGPKAQH